MNERCERLQALIKKTLDKHAPLKLKKKRKINSHWNQELNNLQEELHQAYKNFQENPTEANAEEHDRLKRLFKRKNKYFKKKAWRRLGFDTTDPSAASKLHKILNGGKSQEIGLMTDEDGNTAKNMKDSLEAVMRSHFPGSTQSELADPVDKVIPEGSVQWITKERVVKAIHRFKPRKATGPDGIHPVVLQHLPESLIEELVTIYTACLRAGDLPELWKRARVVLIPKAGKQRYDKPSSFRPITLSNHLLKVVERLMVWHIEETALKTNPISERQHAYKSNSSTESAILATIDRIERELVNNKFVVLVTLDITNAFNGLETGPLCDAFTEKGVDRETVEFFRTLLDQRLITIEEKGEILNIRLTRGVPQGGVGSTNGWNVVADRLDKRLKDLKKEIWACLFADDTSMLASGGNLTDVCRRMQSAIRETEKWAKDHGLAISAEKSEMMIVTSNNRKATAKLLIGGKPIPIVESVKFLGIRMHRNGRWTAHLEEKLKKTRGMLMRYKAAYTANWGPHQKAFKWIYETIIRPKISYAAVVWAHIIERWDTKKQEWVQNKSVTNKLRKLQRLALSQMALIRARTPGRGLELITGTTPLHLALKETRLKAAIRLLPHINEMKGKTAQKLREDLWKYDLTTRPERYDRVPKRNITEDKFSIVIDDGVPTEQEDHEIHVFSDGSKVDGHTGAAALIRWSKDDLEGSNIMKRLDDYCTVFQAEANGIKEGAQLVLQNIGNSKKVTFFVDSQAAIRSLVGTTAKSRTVCETLDVLNKLSEKVVVVLRWVKAHCGHQDNETVDEIAKQATMQELLRKYPIPASAVNSSIRERILTEWQEEWDAVPGHEQTKIFFPKIDRKKSKQLLCTGKETYSRAVRFITGFNNLRYHNWNLKTNSNPRCRLCEDKEEKAHHLVFECPCLKLVRSSIFKYYSETRNEHKTWSVSQLLTFLRLPPIMALEDSEGFDLLYYDDYAILENIQIEDET